MFFFFNVLGVVQISFLEFPTLNFFGRVGTKATILANGRRPLKKTASDGADRQTDEQTDRQTLRLRD